MNETTVHLSKFLTLQDATKARVGFANTPNEEQLEALKYWGLNIYDPICEHFGVPPLLHSVFRDDAYNEAVGGDPKSEHRLGRAGDLDFDGFKNVDNKMLFDWSARNLNFNQIIWEKGTIENPAWVHISALDGVNAKRLTRCVMVDGKTTYRTFDLYKFPI